MHTVTEHKLARADKALVDFIYCFSSVKNLSEMEEGVIIPNGRIDLFFSKTTDGQFHVSLVGLETKPKLISKKDIDCFFAVNFNPLAVEYIFQFPISDILNKEKKLQDNFFGIGPEDLNNFDMFCEKISRKVTSLLPGEIDERKRNLFKLIFETNGEISVKELSEKVSWSARQMNHYFNLQFGLSLKAYCNILRFQASLPYIKAGNLFPQFNFYDQSHFIKESKKLSGASPKELYKNINSRFLQFSVIETD